MSDGFSATFLGATQRYWQERAGECVSAEDAAESIRNVSEFFGLLKRWDAADQRQGTGDEVAAQENAPEAIER